MKNQSTIVKNSDNLELPGVPPVPKKRGRPVTGKALSNAERQARNRAYKKIKAVSEMEKIADSLRHLSDEELFTRLKNPLQRSKELFIEAGRRNGWI